MLSEDAILNESLSSFLIPVVWWLRGDVMNMKSMLGAFLALVLAVGGTAFLVSRVAKAKPGVNSSGPPVPVNGVYRENPFPLESPGSKPKATVAELMHKFGSMPLGAERSHEFVFKNEGDAPLKLAKGPLMCKCTMPDVPDQEIKPGESLAIKLTWRPEDVTQEFVKTAVIWTNDPENAKVTLAIEGVVFEDPGASPRFFNLGDIPWDKAAESDAHFGTVTYKDLDIEGFESSDPDILSVTWSPEDISHFPTAEGATEGPVKSFLVKLKVAPNGKVGSFQGWIKLKLKNCLATEHRFDVSGNRAGPIAIHGPDYQASLTMIDMRRFKSAEGRKTRLFMFLEPFGEDLQITEVISKSKFLSASIQKEASGASAKDRYVLTVEAKPGAIPGSAFTLDNPDMLSIKTNHPKVPEITFKSRYIVQ